MMHEEVGMHHFPFGAFIRLTEDDGVSQLIRDFLDPADGRRKEIVLDLGDNHANRSGLIAFEALRDGIGKIPQLLREAPDTLFRFVAHIRVVDQCTRNR